MMTPDKDYAQLVNDRIFIYKPSRGGNEAIQWGVDDIKKEFSVERPEQVIDILALMGDASDNIPGAPGVGPKTAVKLISEYGSVEELFRHTDNLKGKLKEIIIENREKIELSKKLVTIEINVPVDLDEDKLLRDLPDVNKLKSLFEELEFRTMANKILSETGKIPSEDTAKSESSQQLPLQGTLFSAGEPEQSATIKQTIKEVHHDYRLITDEKDMAEMIAEARKHKEVCFDTENNRHKSA